MKSNNLTLKEPINDVKDLQNAWNEAKQKLTEYQEAVKNGDRKPNKITEQGLQNLVAKIEATINAWNQQQNAIAQAESRLKQFTTSAENAKNKIAEIQVTLQRLQSESGTGKATALQQLFDQLNNAGFDTSKYTNDIQGATQAVRDFENAQMQLAQTGVANATNQINQQDSSVQKLTNDTRTCVEQNRQLNTQMRDVDALKSRIQYFFGLNNAINLFRRAVRSAFNTVKELDKAMTETAVVTDFTVADMWSQLPDYTKRANELGVTTKAAYEAATLYYQQGLKTNEVIAMSNETLKMARIAGLEAADATDRMTNAIRGFNMEINETNAQRIDDVYSRLAAISASNVDEISTAMTKVASLANNANMEFETTAAFLAQIIETTRESAETAGTALKTVVARFSEVKKLVDEGKLSGENDEGEVIDVNKVSEALRVAGIDLNKYFLGEVGLDDIFMELASKWDSLSTVQQRYIATQAAGSRQQSRFIALMSDYARTQELVSEAYNAEGASAEQFAKTQDSLQSKLALLKNAWDRFIMGVTNNEVIKLAVDALTGLLNIINNLTEAFGEGAGSVLKMATALMGLSAARKAFATGGIMDTLLGGLTSGGFLGRTLGTAGGYVGQHAATATAAGGGLGTAITGSLLGKGLGAIGTGISGGALAAGSLGAVAAGLGAVAVAAGIAYVAYKKIYDISPEGQLKALEKQEEKLKEIADEAEKTSKAVSDAVETYKEKTEAVNDAASAQEYAEAIKSRNDYIQSLIEKDETYARYIQSMTEEGGQIVLTLDEDALAKAAEEAAKAATESAIEARRAAIATDAKAIENAQHRSEYSQNDYDWYVQDAGSLEKAKEIYGWELEDLTAEIAEQAQIIQSKTEEMRGEARMLYQDMFDEEFIGIDAKNQLASAFAEIVDITGALTEDQVSELEGMIGTTGMQAFLDAINNVDTDIALTGISNVGDQLERLGITANGDLSTFTRLAEILGLDEEQAAKLNNRLKDYAKQQKEQQAVAQQNLQNRFANLNLADRGQKWIEETGITDQTRVNNLIESVDKILNEAGQKHLFENVFNSKDVEKEVREAQVFINALNFDKPIQAYRMLKDAQANATSELQRSLARDIEESNSHIFSTGNMVQSVLKSLGTEYEDVQKEVDKLMKKNGEITADNIRELADSCEDLKALLEEDIISAEALAEALTGIEDGTLAFEDLTDAVITAMDETTTFQSIVEKLHKYIEDWEDGIDYGEGIDFFAERYEELHDLVENFEFGNPKTQNLWNAIFGSDYMDVWRNSGEDEMRRQIELFADWIDNDAHGYFTDAEVAAEIGLEIQSNGNVSWPDFENDVFKNWDEVIAKVKQGASARGVELSDEACMAIIEAWVSHGDIAVTDAANRIDISAVGEKLAEQFDLSQVHVINDAQLEALASALKIDKQRLTDLIGKEFSNIKILGVTPDIEIPDLVTYVTEGLGDTEQEILQTLETYGMVIEGDGEIPTRIDADMLDTYLSSKGLDDPALRLQVAKAVSDYLGTDLSKDVTLPLQVADALDCEVDSAVVKKIAEAIEKASESEDIKVTLSKVIVEGVKEVTPENCEKIAEITSNALESSIAGAEVKFMLQDAIVRLREEGITPEDTPEDFVAAISQALAQHYVSSGTTPELTLDEIKAIYEMAGIKIDNIDELVTQTGKKTSELVTAAGGIEIPMVNGNTTVKVVVNDAIPPTQEEIQKIVDELNIATPQELYDITYKACIDGGMMAQQAEETARSAQAVADANPIVYYAGIEDGTAQVGYTYNKITGVETFSGANLTERRSGTQTTGVSAITGASVQSILNSTVGEVTLTFANEAEFKAKKKELEDYFAGTKVTVDVANPDSGDGSYEIKLDPHRSVLDMQQEFYDDPITLSGKITADQVETPDSNEVTIQPQAELVETDTTIQSEQTLADNASDKLAEGLASGEEQGLADGGPQAEGEFAKTAEQIAEDLSIQVQNGTLEGSELAAEIEKQALENGVSSSDVAGILYGKLQEAASSASTMMYANIASALSNPIYLNLIGEVQISGTVGATGTGATGGRVKSAASGTNTLSPGVALTGEEAPEIVWNKEKGYAYIVGRNGPQFTNLQAGDRVFNGAETRRILRNSAVFGGMVASYATGRWNPANDGNISSRRKPNSSGGSGSSSSSSEKTPTVWENELDWLYNLVQDIEGLQRIQTRLSERHERYLNDINKTGRDIYNTSKEQLDNLETQKTNEQERLRRRTQEMNEQIGVSGYSNYVWWNPNDQTLEIDWDAIEAIQDKDTYDEVVSLISKLEGIQDEIQTAQDNLDNIDSQIDDINKRYLTDFTDFQSRTFDAVVNGYQSTIDNLSSLNDTLNETNTAVINSLQKEIEYSRQIRDNTDTERNIADMEARLAYMRRDTTGANESEIRALEKQLEETRQGYSDTLIDQKLSELSEKNDEAAEQRQQQINLMQAQLDYWKESGALWNEVNQLIANGIGQNGSLISGSELEQKLKDGENWKSLSEEQKEVWGNDLITAANAAGAYLIKISEGLDGVSKGVWALLPNSSVTSQKLDYGDDGGYSTGGLNAHTGLAMLHGTPNEPEYVLNARQTDAFLRLSDVLPAMLGNDTGTMNNFGGNTFNLVMNVDSIASDYDVDRLVERVKTDLYEASSYRNVNSIGFVR